MKINISAAPDRRDRGASIDSLLGISAGGLTGSIITATAGAALLLFIVGLIKKA